ncbi:MAG: bifunctional diguanylate cyclase/phosphodiesterase [Burkholderiaceae bacterium]
MKSIGRIAGFTRFSPPVLAYPLKSYIPVPVIARRNASGRRRQRVVEGRIHHALAWLGICCVLIAALWSITLFKLHAEKNQIAKDALKDAGFLSQSYAEQLTRSIQQIDQITLHLRYEWKKSGGAMELESQPEEGLFPLVSNLHAWIVDRNGIIQTSSIRGDVGRSVVNQDYFQTQKVEGSREMLIGTPTGSYLSDQAVIHFSRRITAPDGSFDGVVVVGAAPAYLESFISELSLGRNDSVTLKKQDGTLLASKRGENIRDMPTIYRRPSVFSDDRGVVRKPGEEFVDGAARIVAWHKLKNYPLMSIVNQSEADVFAGYNQIARDYRMYALGGSVVLLLFSIVGLSFSSRLAKKRRAAEELKNIYRLATEAAREGFFTVRAVYGKDKTIEDFVIVDCNDRGAEFIGFNKSFLIGTAFSAIYTSSRAQQVFAVFRGAMKSGFYEDELKLSTRDKSRPVWLVRRLVRLGDGLAVTLRDISDHKAHELELAKLANTDALTALPNRHWMMNYLPTSLEQAKKIHASVALLLIDLDDFKNVNDTLGHAAGDELLKAVAAKLQSLLRPGDHIVRLGGDEFIIISEGYEISANVSPLAERIFNALNEPFTLKNGNAHAIRASIGISVYPQDGFEPDTLVKHADIAMYAAKNEGKNRYEFYQAQFSEALQARLNNELAIRSAIDMDEFVLYFQPRVDTVTGELKSLEALIRWQHPVRGLVSPVDFIPFAERSELIVDIGSLVLDKVCRQIAEWKSLSLPVVPVSVNVSAKQINQGDLISILGSCMERHGIDVSLLEIEITESSMVDDNLLVLEELSAMKKRGIKLLIDDFGTGYSSMSQLHRLDLDVLKIDQAFTRSLGRVQKGEAFFKAMISMAHGLGMQVVAEGVETKEQLVLLRTLSCDEVQGYYISEPVLAEEIVALLKKRFLFPGSSLLH